MKGSVGEERSDAEIWKQGQHSLSCGDGHCLPRLGREGHTDGDQLRGCEEHRDLRAPHRPHGPHGSGRRGARHGLHPADPEGVLLRCGPGSEPDLVAAVRQSGAIATCTERSQMGLCEE